MFLFFLTVPFRLLPSHCVWVNLRPHYAWLHTTIAPLWWLSAEPLFSMMSHFTRQCLISMVRITDEPVTVFVCFVNGFQVSWITRWKDCFCTVSFNSVYGNAKVKNASILKGLSLTGLPIYTQTYLSTFLLYAGDNLFLESHYRFDADWLLNHRHLSHFRVTSSRNTY